MATVREKGPYQWQVQIRRKGWPNQTATFRTKKEAQAWARKTESEMDRGLFVDQSGGRRTTLADLIELYLREVTVNRPGADSRIAETNRLKRFLREERGLCAYAVSNLTPEHFEDYRDRRLSQSFGRGKTIAPGTVKRELTLLKRVIDYRKRRLGLLINPVNIFGAIFQANEIKRLSNVKSSSVIIFGVFLTTHVVIPVVRRVA